MAAGETLILEAKDFKDPLHWRWVLKDCQGKFLAEQEVSLDSGDPNYSAFIDLESFLKDNSSPDRWLEDQIRLMQQVGSWMGKEVLGSVAERITKFSTPITVLVQVPPEASGLLYWPWEMAQAGGKPLALRNVSLVYEIMGEKPEIKTVPVQDRLRMLAVFSLPTDESPLSLRRERYQLMKLIRDLAQSYGFAIDMRVLQYGTTRQSLQEALEEGEGWDLIHFSGHGDKAMLILEHPDGSHDKISSEDLSGLLSLASGRLKLVILSACLSAAATVQETLEWLKIPVTQTSETKADNPTGPVQVQMPALAVELMTKLDCAVLAMRYRVGDEFAISLASELYRQLMEKGNTLPRSLQISMQKALKYDYNAATPPLSLATPALFGSRSTEMIIKPPLAPEGDFVPPRIGLSYFPPEPKRFVGRSRPLGRASSAMARDSEKRGVIFQGMAGAGKTACALETAYHQSRIHRFRHFVWHQAPKENEEIEGALVKLALDIQKQLPWVKMVHLVDRSEEFKAWLPVLSKMLEQNSILIVLDNLENLLTSDGGWKDERWGWLIDALLNHDGLSRLVLTSRNPLQDLEGNNRLIVEQINSLSRNESMLLAREMPNLGKLLLGKSPVGLEKGRDLVKRILFLVQGHPKLIELADAQAADPAALEKYLASALEAWSEEKNHLDRFFLVGESHRSAERFLNVFSRWTQEVSRSLPPASLTLLQFLCALEDADRLDFIVKQVWTKVWMHLGLGEEAPGLEQTLNSIESAALVDHRALGDEILYVIHPGVVQAILKEADDKFLAAVDVEMTAFLLSLFQAAWSGKVEGADEYIVMIGRRSVPYLIRQKMWSIASAMLGQVIYRDSSPDLAASILPLLRFIANNTRGDDSEVLVSEHIAHALLNAGRWQECEETTRSLISKHLALGDLKGALRDSGDLFNLLYQTGRYEEALVLVEIMEEYVHQAELGPWTQLMVEGQRLQVLSKKGEYDKILDTVADLREKMRHMPEKSNLEEMVDTSAAKFSILDAGRSAAILLRKNELGLELNTEIIEIQRSKGATKLELARHSFNGFYPLLYLERYDEAEKLLISCLEVFKRKKSIQGLGSVFSALAELKARLGQIDLAISFEETSLHYSYLFGDPAKISSSHHNLALYMSLSRSKSSLDHSLAAACICFQIYSDLLASSLKRLALDLNRFGLEAIPKSFDELCTRVEQVEGIRFRELWAQLPRRAEDGDLLLKDLVKIAQEQSTEKANDSVI